MAFLPFAKEMFEVTASICGGHSRKQKARIIDAFGGDLRRTLDSDGDRWGSRMRVIVEFESKPHCTTSCWRSPTRRLRPLRSPATERSTTKSCSACCATRARASSSAR